MSKHPAKTLQNAAGAARGDSIFVGGLGVLAACYMLLIVGMLAADASYTTPAHLLRALGNADIRSAIVLSLVSCSISAILSVLVAVPVGYLMSRRRFPLKKTCEAILDMPIVLPPMVVGLSLLILFNQVHIFGRSIEVWCQAAFAWLHLLRPGLELGVTYKAPAVILAQFTVACAFAIRAMRGTFDHISPRTEEVALTLGCSRAGAFWRVAVPEAWRGIVAAGSLAWARSLGEFGPILVFAGATRGKTEVLPTTIFLEISVGNLEGAVAVALLMVLIALGALVLIRHFGGPEQNYLA